MSESVYTGRLQELRAVLQDQRLDGMIVPMADDYQNEYVAPCDKRIKFLTGFTGSAGYVLVLRQRALFFTDSRYLIQAKEQLAPGLYEVLDLMDTAPSVWLETFADEGLAIGFDPRLHTLRQVERLESVMEKRKGRLVPLAANPIDLMWAERPARPCAPVVMHALCFAGKSFAEKSKELAGVLKEKKVDAVILTDPASVAWLLNVRGGDVPHTPLPLSVALFHAEGRVDWFVDPSKLSADLRAALDPAIAIQVPQDFMASLAFLGNMQKAILLDPDVTPFVYCNAAKKAGAKIVRGDDPCALPRARKNAVELDGMATAHERDAVAMIRFLHWLDVQIEAGVTVTEVMVQDRLEAFRAEGKHYRGPSFKTIAGAGPHGAIIHYSARPDTNRALAQGEFLLLDSGGQYLDGTTDVTRTIPCGGVLPEMMNRYTRVLRGHIALVRARFPKGITGAHLDVLARQYLWADGLDFGHGTGHGVGCYLGVHEGPQTISRRSQIPLEAGMVLSNEPGFYKEGAYGIRLENLQAVVLESAGGGERFDVFGFRPLTLVPFDTRPLLVGVLGREEKSWLNAYHAEIYEKLALRLDEDARAWLACATQLV